MVIHKAHTSRIRQSMGDNLFDVVVNVVAVLVMLLVLIPLIFVVAASFSDPDRVLRGEVFLWPKGFTLEPYKMVFENQDIWLSYRNTIFYTVAGTAINIVMTILAAFPLPAALSAVETNHLPYRVAVHFMSGNRRRNLSEHLFIWRFLSGKID